MLRISWLYNCLCKKEIKCEKKQNPPEWGNYWGKGGVPLTGVEKIILNGSTLNHQFTKLLYLITTNSYSNTSKPHCLYWKIFPVIKREVKVKRIMTVLNDLGKFGRHAFGKRWLWPFLYTFLTLTKRTAEQRTSHNLLTQVLKMHIM
jgi:hypothetical protein